MGSAMNEPTSQPFSDPTVDDASSAQANQPRSRSLSRRRLWFFRTVVVVFPFAVIAFIEALLVWANVGTNVDLLLRASRIPGGKAHYLNPRTDIAYSAIDLRGPEPRTFDLPKPSNTFRVIVIGASTVQGYPYPSELAFPRQIELLLSKQLHGRNIEVLNAGIIGLSTTLLVGVVSQAVSVAPDAIVFYEGHNEFYGVGGVATNARTHPITTQARQYRLGQVLTGLFARQKKQSGDLISALPADFQIPFDSPLIQLAEQRYRDNLKRISAICTRAQIPLLLCSVASNLRDQSPLRSTGLPETGRTELSSERRELELKLNSLINDANYAEAYGVLTVADQRNPDDALLQYRLGQCLEHLGEKNRAAQCFAQARDLDPCRYRAPGSFRDILRQVVTDGGAGIHMVDLAETFAQGSEQSAPGHDLFLEHVHFNQDGHWLAARTIARHLVRDVCGQSWDEAVVPTMSERDEWLGLIPEDHLVALTLALFVGQRPPFNEAVDVDRHQRFLSEQVQETSQRLSPPDMKAFMSLDHQAKMDDLLDGLGRYHLSTGEVRAALGHFERSKRRRPWMPNPYVFAAVSYHRLGQKEEALSNFIQSHRTAMSESKPLIRDRDRLEKQLGSKTR